MKITGRNIKRRLAEWGYRPSDIKRARYWRGHGVHSPFVYNIVRQVFMCKYLKHDNRELYDRLKAEDIPNKRCVQLQNLLHHCGYTSFGIDCDAETVKRVDMAIITTKVAADALPSLAMAAKQCGTTLCILAPAFGRERRAVCGALVEAHTCTSIDNRGYLLLLNNHLPKQKFRL